MVSASRIPASDAAEQTRNQGVEEEAGYASSASSSSRLGRLEFFDAKRPGEPFRVCERGRLRRNRSLRERSKHVQIATHPPEDRLPSESPTPWEHRGDAAR